MRTLDRLAAYLSHMSTSTSRCQGTSVPRRISTRIAAAILTSEAVSCRLTACEGYTWSTYATPSSASRARSP